jgi:DNA polymerase-3 subunit beta
VFLHVADGQLAAAASDGHRLARRLCALPGGAADMPGVIVPGNAVREIVAMLEEGDATVTVGESLIRISVPDLTFSSSLIGSTFPPYDRLISFERQPEITVHPRVMIEAIERALVLYQGTDIKMPAAIFRAADGKLNMDAGAARFDTGSEEIEATIHASDARFRCNVKYLAEMLKVWPADVDLDIQTNNDGPILFTAGDAPDMTHIIMPQHKG